MKSKLQELKNFYNGRNVYITGITGFKGTWLALMLKELGANVQGIGLVADKNSLSERVHLDKEVEVAYGDITAPANDSCYLLTVSHHRPDVIFHLAAQALVSEGYKEPFDTFNTNIMGTVITHEVARALDKKVSLVNVTTDKVYKESDKPFTESDELRGFDPYSLSKSCSDMITSCYRDCFNDSVISSTMRAGNVIGGGDFSDNRIIPDFVRAAQEGSVLELRNPNSVRPYQHVFDSLTAYLTIGMLQYQDESFAGEYNVGPKEGQIAFTKDLVELAKEIMPVETKYNKNASIGHENPNLQLDSSLLRETTGWAPVFNSIESVINSTISWYNNVINGTNEKDELLNQIRGGFKAYDQE